MCIRDSLLHGRMNPRFFEGTRVEAAARTILDGDADTVRGRADVQQ